MEFERVVKDGVVVTSSHTMRADVGIVGEKITAVGPDLPIEGAEVVSADNCLVLPGCIDVHTHLDDAYDGLRTSDDFESGTIAAAWGGTTTIIDFATQLRGQRLQEGLDAWHEKAESRAAIDYAFHLIVSELSQNQLADVNGVVSNEGVTSFKLFMAYPGTFMLDDTAILKMLLQTKETGALVCIHAENGGIIDVLVNQALADGHFEPKYHAATRPMSTEVEATRRAILLAEIAGVPIYIVHLSAAGALQEVREARARGLPVYAETCPQYLFLSEREYERPGFEGAKYVMAPPLRPPGNEEELWKGLASEDLQIVSTDHSSFCFHDPRGKRLGIDNFSSIPFGAPGIENRLELMHQGVNQDKITLNRLVDILATTPAKTFGLYPRKGAIQAGSDADLVIFDPTKKKLISSDTHHMQVDYNPYEGFEITGAVKTVFLRGETIVADDKFLGRPGKGQFIKRVPVDLGNR